MRPLVHWVALIAIVALHCACDKGPASIEVTPENGLIKKKGGSLQLTATVKDKDGKVLPGAQVAFKSMTPTMATVDAGGIVRAVSSGRATVLVTSGDVSQEAEVLVQIPKQIRIEPANPMLMLGVTRGFKATVYTDKEEPMIAGGLRWATSDPEIFTVDERGNVKTVGEGKATLTVYAAGIEETTPILVKHEEIHEDGTLSQ